MYRSRIAPSIGSSIWVVGQKWASAQYRDIRSLETGRLLAGYMCHFRPVGSRDFREKETWVITQAAAYEFADGETALHPEGPNLQIRRVIWRKVPYYACTQSDVYACDDGAQIVRRDSDFVDVSTGSLTLRLFFRLESAVAYARDFVLAEGTAVATPLSPYAVAAKIGRMPVCMMYACGQKNLIKISQEEAEKLGADTSLQSGA